MLESNKIGYACISMQLSYPQKFGGKERGVLPITTNRSMIKRTFLEKGVDYASELILNNVKDLNSIISWNILGYKEATIFSVWLIVMYYIKLRMDRRFKR